MGVLVSSKILGVLLLSCCVLAGNGNRFPNHRNVNYKILGAASETAPLQQQDIPAPQAPANGGGYLYAPPTTPFPIPAPGAVAQSIAASTKLGESIAFGAATVNETRAAAFSTGITVDASHHMPQLIDIQVQCGKERMMVVVTFDSAFNGVIYAKGHYSDPACRYVNPNSGQSKYMFDMKTGTCGVEFIDSGLKQGGQAYVEGLMVILYEAGVQEAWDAARQVRCLWEGNIDQTVSFPFNVNMLDLQPLEFSGDTATASLEVQMGRGPRAPAVQGMVRIGEMLTAVVKVVGDPDFDLLVRDCVATDGTPNNRIMLTDRQGCALKTKLMGGWKKQKTGGNIFAYAQMSAFKFPDVMQMYLECAVSLCKGECDQCPTFEELHDPSHHHTTSGDIDIRVGAAGGGARARRSVEDNVSGRNYSEPEESVLLRKIVNVVGPEDFPEFYSTFGAQSPRSDAATTECFSLMTIMAATFVAVLLIISTILIITVIKRGSSSSGYDAGAMKFYNPTSRP